MDFGQVAGGGGQLPLNGGVMRYVVAASAAEERSKGEASSSGREQYVFLAGAMSGVCEGLSIQPLELLKTRFQINTGEPLRILPTIRDILREGGFLQFYRGAMPEITGLIPRATAALSTLEFSQRLFRSWDQSGQLSIGHGYVSGGLSGISEGVAFQPFQVIKVRMMAKEHLGRYANSWDCVRKVVGQEGLGALAIGFGPTMWRNTIWNSIYYGTMHYLQTASDAAAKSGQAGASVAARVLAPLGSPVLETCRTIALGTAVGMFATCFNAPFDVVKSRFQSQLPSEARLYRYTLPSLVTIASREGPRALYKGFLPKALRLGIGQTIGLMVFNSSLRAFGAHHEQQ